MKRSYFMVISLRSEPFMIKHTKKKKHFLNHEIKPSKIIRFGLNKI